MPLLHDTHLYGFSWWVKVILASLDSGFCSCLFLHISRSRKTTSSKCEQLRTADPEGFREKTKTRFERHDFPFREQSLDEVRNSADAAQSRLTLAIRILRLAERLKSQKVLDTLKAWSSGVSVSIDQISDDTQRLLPIARSDETDKNLKWLSPPNPWTNHHSARTLHQAGTGGVGARSLCL
jgi:hypothetical protein